ncbi:DegT/DnrJ/EryC1/StrS family aminotransferase [Catenuloplanes japonicus]|uniref:DegT/DnrJ/EryC1/StrS family aminotransferase n=1 Tax=Catenuloplanes japonicus TaxID=33876 RepID=UPI0005266A63|nr:DegT/DnrJ/EryC1/StrS family aminotransferase [Catenuloplanes japonicus]
MIPFFPPDLFTTDRDLLHTLLHEVGTDPGQRFILGERVTRLERALSARLDGADVVACGSGTVALELILRAAGIGQGDEVIVPAFGCAPLASAVIAAGAVPVFADVTPGSLTMDPQAAAALITPRTRALMPAHMFSVMADMPAFREIADAHGLRLIEDSAVAQGATLHGRPAGLWGDAGLFSFVQVKTFGGIGEGAVVVTTDPAIGAAVRMLRNHGQDGVTRFLHHRIGHNSRFDELMAGYLLHRLPTLDERLDRRAAIGRYYTSRLTSPAVETPPATEDGRCYYVYNLLAGDRDRLRDHLAAHGVGTHAYYPAALPHQPAFAPWAAPRTGWPVAEDAARRCLALPIYPHLTDAQVEKIADAVMAA